MAIRTVRLDAETEQVLESLRRDTDLSISELFKLGLTTLKQNVSKKRQKRAFELYSALDLGPGGWSIGKSTEISKTVKAAVRKKLGR